MLRRSPRSRRAHLAPSESSACRRDLRHPVVSSSRQGTSSTSTSRMPRRIAAHHFAGDERREMAVVVVRRAIHLEGFRLVGDLLPPDGTRSRSRPTEATSIAPPRSRGEAAVRVEVSPEQMGIAEPLRRPGARPGRMRPARPHQIRDLRASRDRSTPSAVGEFRSTIGRVPLRAFGEPSRQLNQRVFQLGDGLDRPVALETGHQHLRLVAGMTMFVLKAGKPRSTTSARA